MSFIDDLMGPWTAQAQDRSVPGIAMAKVSKIIGDGTYELAYISRGGDEPSAPARVMMPMAGGKRGTYFYPEVGDEVVVAFESGNVNLPIILGAVWNEDDTPPEQAKQSSDNDVRTIVSRSGHELTFDDTPGGEKVTIRTKGGHEVTLDDTEPGRVTIVSNGGHVMEMDDGTQTLRLSSPFNLSLEAPNISISATNIDVDAPGGMRIMTTGFVPSSLCVIDGKPFGLHLHLLPPGTTGTVVP